MSLLANQILLKRIERKISAIGGGGGGGGELTADSIDSSHIINGSILSTDICNNTITGTDIASATITGSKIANETIVGDNIANDTIGLNKIEPFVGATLKKLLNPTGLITIYNRGSSTEWFIFKIYYSFAFSDYQIIIQV